MDPNDSMASFEKLRTMEFYCLYFASFLGGMLETIFFSTEYLYIRDTINADRPTLYFGIGTAFQHLSGMTTAFIGSVYYDRTRHVRCAHMFSCSCVIVASILYVLPYSVWLVIFGNFLYGFICITNSVMIAELVHVFPQHDVTRKVAIIASFFSFGLIAGPAFVYAFVLVDVKVGTWRLGFGNMPALVVGSVYIIYIFFAFKFVHDLSLVYDLKLEEEQQRLLHDKEHNTVHTDQLEGNDQKVFRSAEARIDLFSWFCSYLQLSCGVISEKHFAILLFTTAVATFSHFLFLGITVVKASDLLHWDSRQIANLRLIMACGVVVASLVIQACTRCIHDYYLLLSSVLLTVFALCAMGLLPYFAYSRIYATTLLYVASALYGFLDAPIQIIARAMVAKLVPSQVQGIAEATRFSVFQAAQIFSGLGLSFTVSHLAVGMFLIAAFNLINLLVLLSEHNFYLKNSNRLNLVSDASKQSASACACESDVADERDLKT